jgi:hypothetical protein
MANRVRHRDSVKVFAAGKDHERRVVSVCGQAKAARLLNDYRATMVFDDDGDLEGIRLCESRHAAKKAMRAPVVTEEMRNGCVVLSKAEVESLADRMPSRTARLTEEQRDARVAKGLPEMDLAESARVKFQTMFPGHKNFASQAV